MSLRTVSKTKHNRLEESPAVGPCTHVDPSVRFNSCTCLSASAAELLMKWWMLSTPLSLHAYHSIFVSVWLAGWVCIFRLSLHQSLYAFAVSRYVSSVSVCVFLVQCLCVCVSVFVSAFLSRSNCLSICFCLCLSPSECPFAPKVVAGVAPVIGVF